ncbi:hypothetical protein IF1G_07135 [Cordyceps javanica]|uniref:Uncharacterized protein n=1 Tax=Cordyceps javanica TaxID=43265 RepID=A0A545VWN1_9HYPO|nr:hypothetical protein IF1G_07135 [Cordyceps javanica]TQW06130.1 hypothetical protein IF2G_06413 [Cordyceps javanica]
MAHDVEAGSSAIRDHVALNSGAASVPRSFHHADLIISSDDSDQDANADKLPIMAQVAVTDDVPPVPSVESCTSLYSCGLELPTAQTKLLSPGQSKQPQRDFQAPKTAASREVIYIDSTDESERDDVDACTPIRRLTLHESSFDMPTSKAPATSVERVCSPKKTHATLFVRPQNASVETESSEDNIPLALLRERRLRNKRMRSCDEATDFALLNRPMTRLRQSVTARSQRRDFDSDAFDAMIYGQSRNKPPPGVSIPRPTKAMYVAPHDTRVFVSANPAIHGPVVRSDSWWKDKAKEIQKRPKRKQWFGKVTQRMRWLYQKQMVEEVKRHDARTRSSAAARQTRPEPQPAAYRRIMDFGDVPENQLPPDLLSNRAWVKGCAWFRKMREEDAAMRREVEHSTQRAWQYYQTVLNNSD